MNKLLVGVAGVAALALVGCVPPHPRHHDWGGAAMKVIAKLDCPEDEGDLTRKSQSADGKTCLYATDDGTQVTLQLVTITNSDVDAALAPIETGLKAETPAPPTGEGPTRGQGQVDINLAGIHIHADGKDGKNDNEHASVSVGGGPGLHAGVQVNANDNGAEIHVDESTTGLKRTVIHASDTAGPNGFKLVGFEARGPRTGPLVVAIVKSKDNDHDIFHDDLNSLLDRNVGG